LNDEILASIERFANRPIYHALSAEIVAGIKDRDLEQGHRRLRRHAREGGGSPRCRDRSELTPPTLAVYATRVVEDEPIYRAA
jgi:hypothetical protein